MIRDRRDIVVAWVLHRPFQTDRERATSSGSVGTEWARVRGKPIRLSTAGNNAGH
jgi:hypothetical protein